MCGLVFLSMNNAEMILYNRMGENCSFERVAFLKMNVIFCLQTKKLSNIVGQLVSYVNILLL